MDKGHILRIVVIQRLSKLLTDIKTDTITRSTVRTKKYKNRYDLLHTRVELDIIREINICMVG